MHRIIQLKYDDDESDEFEKEMEDEIRDTMQAHISIPNPSNNVPEYYNDVYSNSRYFIIES